MRRRSRRIKMWIGMDSDLRIDDHVRGPDEAELVVVYADFTCPYCALAHARLTELAAELPVRRVFRHLALKTKHPRAVALGCAAEAAALQGAFWPFHDAVYADQGRIDDPHLWELARRLGLDVDRFEADRRSSGVIERVQRDTKEAVLAGAMTTPTFFANGKPDQARYHEVVHNE
jgi:protein-disulfide isomerase